MAKTTVFISHSSHDNAWCRPFADALKAIGYDVWYDETGLQGGAAWVSSIQHEVENREVFLVVLTPESWASKWVQDELQLAIATRRRILPVLLRNTQVSGFLVTTQWITVVGEESKAAARAVVMAIEAPPAPGRSVAPVVTSETLDDLVTLCKSLAAEQRYTEALSTCARALSLDPKNIDVLKVKAKVLVSISEENKAALTLAQILSLDPNDDTAWSECSTYFWSMRASTSTAHEMLQVYWALRSTYTGRRKPYGGGIGLTSVVRCLLSGLAGLNKLNAATGPLLQLDDDVERADALRQLSEGYKFHDLAVRIYESWYGYPPKVDGVATIPGLCAYAASLREVGRIQDDKYVYKLVVRIYESRYGNPPAWDRSDSPYNFASARTVYDLYLSSLEAIGRTEDAARLRPKA